MRHSMGGSADLLCAGMTLAKGSCSARSDFTNNREVAKINKHMKATQDRQKKWVGAKRRLLEFAVGDPMYFLRSHQLEGSLGSAAVGS